MKRILSVLLVLSFAVSAFCGCSGDVSDKSESSDAIDGVSDNTNDNVSMPNGGLSVNPETSDESKAEESIPNEVGKMFFFGAYEQDNNESNGKEPIEWIILDKKDDSILVISQRILDNKQYHSNRMAKKLYWAESDLRAWLNEEFLNTAFSAEEQEKIKETAVKEEGYKVSASDKAVSRNEESMNKLYVLSLNEAKTYFPYGSKAFATEYAKAQGILGFEDNKYGDYWWLRSLKITSLDAHWATVTDHHGKFGEKFNLEYSVDTKRGIRPVMWLKIK